MAIPSLKNNIHTLILGDRECRLKAYEQVQGVGVSKITKSEQTYVMDDPTERLCEL